MFTLPAHMKNCNQVQWHPSSEKVFASVGGDGLLKLWDHTLPKPNISSFRAHDVKISLTKGRNNLPRFQQVRAASRHRFNWQVDKDLGFEKPHSSSEHSASPPLSTQKGEIFASSWVVTRVGLLRYECEFLRLERPCRAVEIQARPTHGIRNRRGFQLVWLEIGLFVKLGWTNPGLGMGPTSAYHHLTIQRPIVKLVNLYIFIVIFL